MKAFLLKSRSWLQRHRRLALSVSALVIIFEISRAAAIGQFLMTGWGDDASVRIESLTSRPLWIVIVTFILAAIFFAAPMAAVLYAGLKVRRALSRYWTGDNRSG